MDQGPARSCAGHRRRARCRPRDRAQPGGGGGGRGRGQLQPVASGSERRRCPDRGCGRQGKSLCRRYHRPRRCPSHDRQHSAGFRAAFDILRQQCWLRAAPALRRVRPRRIGAGRSTSAFTAPFISAHACLPGNNAASKHGRIISPPATTRIGEVGLALAAAARAGVIALMEVAGQGAWLLPPSRQNVP